MSTLLLTYCYKRRIRQELGNILYKKNGRLQLGSAHGLQQLEGLGLCSFEFTSTVRTPTWGASGGFGGYLMTCSNRSAYRWDERSMLDA